MTTSVAISDTGMAMTGMRVVRQLCRKMKTTQHDQQQRLEQRDHHVVHRGRHERVVS